MIRVALALIAASTIGCAGGTTTPTNPKVEPVSLTAGTAASDFTAVGLDGKSLRLAEHFGRKAIVLNFWATWCEPCIAEFAHLGRIYDANKDRGLVVVGISLDGPDSVPAIAPFLRRTQVSFPIVIDHDSHVAELYNPVRTAPLTVLIDRQARIYSVRWGYNPGDEQRLAEEISKVLDGPTASR